MAALRGEPKTLNPVLARTDASYAVLGRLMAGLIHINRFSRETRNRTGEIMDGFGGWQPFHPKASAGDSLFGWHLFDADDVVFTFQIHLDETIGSPYRDLLVVDGQPIKVRKRDQHTVDFELAGRTPWVKGYSTVWQSFRVIV